jgi:hypothetical protein
MPLLIEHIDAIARQKQRDVLFVEFHSQPTDDESFIHSHDWQGDPKRQALIKWLDKQEITWCCCSAFASEDGFDSYQGQIYIDLPMDEANPSYCQLCDHLEHPDGSMRDEQVCFYVLPLEAAMRNAHHDQPEFWQQWAEDF